MLIVLIVIIYVHDFNCTSTNPCNKDFFVITNSEVGLESFVLAMLKPQV